MDTKTKIIVCMIVLLSAYAFGRFSAPEKVKTVTKVVTVEKKTETKASDAERDKHKETTVTEVKRPDGTVEKTTKTVEDTTTSKKTTDAVKEVKNETSDTTKESIRGSAKVTISALAAINVTDFTKPPVYGVAVSKPILGPITVGFFGFNDGRIGVSAGLTF